jgi:hypothetical protein
MNNMYGGSVVIQTIDRKTGDILDEFGPESNMVLDQGATVLWKRLSTSDSASQSKFSSIAIGTDFGDVLDWSSFNPEPPNRDMTEDDQDVIYFVPVANMEYTYPDRNVIQVIGLIDGVQAMNQSFPTSFDAEFSSATLRVGDNKAFAYKRFPARYITRDVDIRIIWTLTMQNARTFCGFQTPTDSGVSSLYIANQIELIKIDTNGEEEWKYTPHANRITAVSADMSNYVYTGDETGLTQKNSNQRTLIWQNLQTNLDFPNAELSNVIYDDRGNIYTSALNGEVKKLTENGGQIWRYHDEVSEFVYVYGVDSDYWAYVYNPQRDYIVRVDPNGIIDELNQGEHPSAITDAVVDSDGMSFTISADQTIRVFSNMGELLLSSPTTNIPTSVSLRGKTSIVVGFTSGAVSVYDYSLNEIWTTILTNPVSNVVIDSDGAVYASVLNTNDTYKLSPTGTVEWSYKALAPISAIAVDRTTT